MSEYSPLHMPIGKPLSGLLVLDFSQFLAGPFCALRLADMGARVIKIERPDGGDLSRQLYISNLELDGDSTLFHSINRNKQGFSLDLKNAADLKRVKKLISHADVVIQNFRPGVIERLGLGYEELRTEYPRLVYASISGYGKEGPWRNLPGQDLLAQAVSGITWLSGDADQGPVPFGLSIADMLTGAYLAQGILACLVRRGITSQGGLVEVSLLEAILDCQFELLTTYLNDGGKLPHRSEINNANAYLSAPYGIYATSDGYLALAMNDIPLLGQLLDCPKLLEYTNPKTWFSERDTIKALLAGHLRTKATASLLRTLEASGMWCAEVFNWPQLLAHDGFKALHMVQQVSRTNGATLTTTRCPIRIDGELLTSSVGAPTIGEHNTAIAQEFNL